MRARLLINHFARAAGLHFCPLAHPLSIFFERHCAALYTGKSDGMAGETRENGKIWESALSVV